MSEQIEAAALVEAVAAFLQSIEGELSGRNAFHAKVAGNALGIVARELAQAPRVAEQAALSAYLGHDAGLDALRAELCGRLRAGRVSLGAAPLHGSGVHGGGRLGCCCRARLRMR